MIAWTDLLYDPTPIKAIFGPTPPTLVGIDLHEIIINRDGPRVLLRFDLRDFPDNPPRKWAVAGFNRVQIRLLVVGVQNLQIVGFQSNIRVNLEVSKKGAFIHLHGDSGTVRFDLVAKSLIVETISAYREE